MNVPFFDLKMLNKELHAELKEAFKQVLESGWFIQGEQLAAFESEFAEFSGTEYCVGVGNGLDAIVLLLKACGVKPGDEVIVPANTFIATWLAVTRCGATPVPVEPDLETFNIDPNRLDAAITGQTSAIIPVHLYGQVADMDPINDIAMCHGLFVIEDAAQSQGATYKGQPSGSLANGAATSFYPGKNLGALGDGGAVLTNDKAIADKVRVLGNYGSEIKYQHQLKGYNSRLDEMQAAFLRVKLKYINDWNKRRQEIAKMYSVAFEGTKIIPPVVPEWANPVWHQYVIQVEERDRLQERLTERGIGTMIHYPIPPHQQLSYQKFAEVSLPVTEALSKNILSLPISPMLSNEEVNEVVGAVLANF